MKTLNEEINEVMKSEQMSVNAKKRALVKIGLCSADLNCLFYEYNKEARMLAREKRAAGKAQEDLLGSLTFGVEIEVINAPTDRIHASASANNLSIAYEHYNHTDNTRYYKFVTDSSLRGADPIECVSPVLKGKQGFSSLKNCCKTLNEAGCNVNMSTGLHIHVGGFETAEQYVNVFRNYQKLERLIDTFMARSRRGNNSNWCQPLLEHNFDNCRDVEDVRAELGFDRYHKVNAEAYVRHHTIEFRQHAGTINYEKIAMWASFCIRLVAWSKDNVLANVINDIADIPFLTDKEKTFFTKRANELANVAA